VRNGRGAGLVRPAIADLAESATQEMTAYAVALVRRAAIRDL
jgi:hypothetical protein